MSSLVILFIALIAVTGSSNKVESSPAQALDLSRVLDLIKQQRLNAVPSKQRKLRLRIVSSDSESDLDDSSTESDDSDDSDSNRLRLRKDRFVDLLETVASEKTNNNRLSYRKGKKNYGQTSDKSDDSENKRLEKERIIDLIETVANANNKNDRIATNRKGKKNYGQTGYLVRSENYDNTQSINNNVQKQILKKLFSQPSIDEKQQLKPKKRLAPNRLTPSVSMDDVKEYYGNKNKNDEVPGLEDYSKVYIVLNPQAVQNSKNKNSLNDLISKVLSLSSPISNKREPQNKRMPPRYKGFVVNENHPKRRFKGINDKIARMDDDEDKLSRLTAMPT